MFFISRQEKAIAKSKKIGFYLGLDPSWIDAGYDDDSTETERPVAASAAKTK